MLPERCAAERQATQENKSDTGTLTSRRSSKIGALADPSLMFREHGDRE
jgi:hypothetical protein